MNLPNLLSNSTKLLKEHSPEILTALSVSGVLTTSVLVGKASYEASKIITRNEASNLMLENRKERFKERARQTWRLYIPAAISGTVTIACVIGASKAEGKRTTAAVAAYSLTEKAFGEYKEKVVEQIGAGKEQKIRDEIVQDKVTKSSEGVVVVGSGSVMCCELYTGRYFRSDMEKLRKAQNDINAKVVSDRYVTLSEFYDLVGLPDTSMSNDVGWDSMKQMNLVFSTVISCQGEPCLAFDYNYVKPI